MIRLLGLAALAVSAIQPARAADRPRLVVVELFTSEGCSSCPPADAVLRDLARSRPDVLALGFHVTYWDYLGWHDPFALPAATQRQRDYAARLHGTVYTPQMMVDGTRDVVGSDAPGVLRAIQLSTASAGARVLPRLRRDGEGLAIDIPAGLGAGTVTLIGYDAEHRTSVARGENGGRSLIEANIVRDVVSLAPWTGEATRQLRPRPAGEHMVVIVQGADGAILGAAREDGDA